MKKGAYIREVYEIPKPELEKLEYEFDYSIDRKNPFFKRVGAFFRGQNKLGRTVGNILDIALVFIPYGKTVNSGRKLLISILNRNTMDKPKLLSKTVWSAIIIAITGVLAALDVSFVSNPETMEVIYNVIFALASALGIYGLRDAVGGLRKSSE